MQANIKKRRFLKSIRFKFIYWFFSVSAVPLLIVGVIVYSYSISVTKKRVFDYIIFVNESKKEHIKTFLNGKKGRTIDFSSDGLIRDLTKEIIKGFESYQQVENNKKMLNTHLANNKVPLDEDISETFIINLNGKIISSSKEESVDMDVSMYDYYQEGRKRVYVSQIRHKYAEQTINPQVSGLPLRDACEYIAVSAPLKDKITNALIGVLVNKVNLDVLNIIIIKGNGLGKNMETYLVNKDQLVIAGLGFRKGCILEQGIDTAGVRESISGNNGINVYDNYRGIPVVGTYAWLEEIRCGLITEIDTAEAFAPLRKIRNMVIIVTIPILSLVIGISFLISRRISKPIITITDAVKKITSGDPEQEISVLTNDELEEISNELNKIVSKMENSYKIALHSERLASVGRIAAGLAHEVNNPLSVLSGRLQMLIEKCTDDTLSEEYNKLLNLANRVEKTVDGLLYFSRQKDTELTSTDINTVLESSISLLEKQMRTHGIKVEKRYGSNLPPVKISASQIQQVFFNIIQNAFDSINEKGIMTIYSSLSGDGDGIRVSFEDTGGGISAKDIDRIFEPFFTTKPPHKGTGLGLSISYGIIQQHNGTINVETKEGKGTTFTINLPVA